MWGVGGREVWAVRAACDPEGCHDRRPIRLSQRASIAPDLTGEAHRRPVEVAFQVAAERSSRCQPEFTTLEPAMSLVGLHIIRRSLVDPGAGDPICDQGMKLRLIAFHGADIGPPFSSIVLTVTRSSRPASMLTTLPASAIPCRSATVAAT